jgi:subtilase family serine protease
MFRTTTLSMSMCVLIVALIAGTTGLLSAPAASGDRIVQPIDETQLVPRGQLRRQARPEFDRGRVNGTRVLYHVSIVFRPSSAQQHALNALLAGQQDPHSPNYHRWLTPEQYGERFGMSPRDLITVSAWLQSKGLTVEETSRGRTEILFTGTVAQIEQAFRTEIHSYQVQGEMHFANATEPSLPAAFADAVLGIRNLDDFRPKPKAHVRTVVPEDISTHFTSSSSGNHFLAPDDFATIYNIRPLYNAGIKGAGQKIAVVGDSAITISDIQTFRKNSNLPANDPQILPVPGTGTATHKASEVEADLDLEWSGGIAPSAHIIYVVAGPTGGGDAFNALRYAVDQNIAPVISNSFGICEASEGLSNAKIVQGWAQQAISQGQTITSASGDSGAADCESSTATTAMHGLAVDVPASVPEVTGIGGTQFDEGTDPSVYWNVTNNASNGSALAYIPETVWNDTNNAQNTKHELSSGGGGKSQSTFFTKPPWQTALTPADGRRDVPDISLNASPFHDGYLICSPPPPKSTDPHPCTNGFRNSGGFLDVVGGTSAGAPAFAGILALINQATNSAGQGNANSILYNLAASTPTAFHDTKNGNNIVPCTQGTTGCPASAPFQYGFSAISGYDLASGLGSVDANVLVTNWPGFAPVPNFFLSANPDPITITSVGASGKSTITVDPSNGFTGTVDLTCTPPTSASSGVGCTISPASVTVTASSATATVTVTTTAPQAVSSESAWVKFGWTSTLFFAGVLILAMPSRRFKPRLLFFGVLVLLAAGAACGGSGSSNTPQPKNPGTPKGSYTITVTGTSGSLSNQANVSVTVQ